MSPALSGGLLQFECSPCGKEIPAQGGEQPLCEGTLVVKSPHAPDGYHA